MICLSSFKTARFVKHWIERAISGMSSCILTIRPSFNLIFSFLTEGKLPARVIASETSGTGDSGNLRLCSLTGSLEACISHSKWQTSFVCSLPSERLHALSQAKREKVLLVKATLKPGKIRYRDSSMVILVVPSYYRSGKQGNNFAPNRPVYAVQ